MSEPDGPGTGIVKHKGGSKSVELLAEEIAAEMGVPIKDVTYSSFKALHVNKDGSYTNKKSARIDARVKEIVEEMRRAFPDTSEERDVDVNKIFLDVMGGGLDKKQRLFGVGSLAWSFRSGASSGSTTATSQFHSPELDNRLGEVEQQLRVERERNDRLEQLVNQLMANPSGSSSAQPDSQTPPPT